MDVRQFLSTVVPWGDGYITIHWCGNKHWRGRSFQGIDAALELVADLQDNGQKNEIYFCISSQRNNSGQRYRDNVVLLRAIPVDFDVDPENPKKYPSLEAAAHGLVEFCARLKLPDPTFIVRSGGGLHAYWVSKTDLTIDEWQPFADALKRAAQALGIKLDPAVTGDAVRILRVPGTSNNKYGEPRPVVLVQSSTGVRYDFAAVFRHVVDQYAGFRRAAANGHAKPVEVAEAFKHLDPAQQPLGEGIEVRVIPPLPFAPIRAQCGWLRTAHETGGRDYDQGLWMLTTLCATFLEDGYNLAHAFADKYPGYTRAETDAMWERKLRERKEKNFGWPSCQAISDRGGEPHCKTCPHLRKGKSPLTLGYLALMDNDDAKEMAALGGERPPELRLPEGFCREIATKRICAFFPSREIKQDKAVAGRLLWLISNTLREPTLQFQQGHYGLAFFAGADKDKEVEVFISSPNVAKANLLRTLLEKCVLYNPEAEAVAMLERFAMSWLDKLRLEDHAIHDSGTMGWRYENGKRIGFVYGDKLYCENGTAVPLAASAGSDMLRTWYKPVGSKEVWLKAAKLLTDRKRPELDCLIAVAFAAPLTVFAGTLYGAVLSVWGRPGTSKSTAQQVAAAVWGHPKQTRESLNSTPKSVQGRLGRTRNLPAYWDDVQDERHQDALFQTMFVASEGAEGGRLNPDASYKERLEWQTLLVACSNLSFVEYLFNKQRSTTAGIRRVFEIEYNRRDDDEPGLINQVEAGRVFAALEHNFGQIGAEYAKILATEHNEINTLVATTIDTFNKTVVGTNEESFWWGICGTLLAGAMLARRLGVELDLAAMEAFLLHTYHANRTLRVEGGTEGGTYQHTQNALSAFLNTYGGAGHVIYVDRAYVRNSTIEVLAKPYSGRPIYIQIARDTRTLSFSKRMFRHYLTQSKIDPRTVLQGLEKFFKATEAKMTLGAGSVHAHTQEPCVEIVVPIGNDALEGFVQAWGKRADIEAAERAAEAAKSAE
jgi:hypothetical protein